MAYKIWMGTVTDNFQTAANWSDNLVPANNDNFIFNDQAVRSVGTGLSNVLTGTTFHFTPGWSMNIGSAGNFLTMSTGTILLHNGRGTDFYMDATFDRVEINTDSQSETAAVLKGSIARLSISSGRVQFNGTTTLTSGGVTVVSATGSSVDGTKLTIPASGMTTTGHSILISGGMVNMSTGIPTCIVDGGRLVLLSAAAVATILHQKGGIVKWNSYGTIAKLECRGGTFDASESAPLNATARRIITEAYMYDDAQVNLDNGAVALDLTNGIYVFGKNSPKVSRGTKISIAA